MGEQIIGRLLPEWLNSNQHRAYPLADSTVGNGIPFGFLVDALFINSPSVDSERLYISSVIRDNTNILIKLSGYVKDITDESSASTTTAVATDFGAVTVPFDTKSGTHVPIAITGDNFTIAGSFVIGDTKCMEATPAIIELDEEKGLLFPGCVRTIDDTLIGIKVNGVLYTGIVTLEAGDGIEFDVTEDEESGEVVVSINSIEYAVPGDNLNIVDDKTLLDTAMESYGRPVRTICGVYPDEQGDIVFAAPSGTGGTDTDTTSEGAEDTSEPAQYVDVTSTGDGTVCLTIANDKTDVTCTDHSAQLASLMQSLSNLNERSVEIDEGLNAADEAISNLALQVSRS